MLPLSTNQEVPFKGKVDLQAESFNSSHIPETQECNYSNTDTASDELQIGD